MNKQTALITGASSGIGAELARVFAANGYNLVLVARSADELHALAAELERQHGVRVITLPKDLSDPAAAPQLFETMQAAAIEVDILANDAGMGLLGRFWQNDAERQLAMLHLNVMALTHLIQLFLPSMVARGNGKILNVASIAAFQPGPLMAVYYASKAYVLSLSEALASELAGTGVTVTALCPGPTRSEFMQRAGLDVSRLFKGIPMSDPNTVARAGFNGLMQGRTLVIPGLLNWLGAQSTRFVPRKLLTAIVRAIHQRVG